MGHRHVAISVTTSAEHYTPKIWGMVRQHKFLNMLGFYASLPEEEHRE
jgi:hypothetical protein